MNENHAKLKGALSMNFSENLENAKNFAMEAAMVAKNKARQVAAIAKTNISIYAEEDKIKKAEQQLGKLYYRDYAVGEEMDTAEYLPWCQKIDESKQLIEELRAYIEELKGPQAEDAPADVDESDFSPAEEPAAEQPSEAQPEEAPAEEKAPEADVVIEINRHDAE